MSGRWRVPWSAGRVLAGLLLTLTLIPLLAGLAAAQEAPEVVDQETVGESVRLVSSKEEVRRAVVGLIGIAGVLTLATGLYWHKSGQDARTRFALAHPRPTPAVAGAQAMVAAATLPVAQSPATVAPTTVRPGTSVFDTPRTRPPGPLQAPTPRPSVFPDSSGPASSPQVAPPAPAPTPARAGVASSAPDLSAEEWWAAVGPAEIPPAQRA